MRHPNSSMPLKTRIFGVEEVENSVVLILNWSISMNHEVFYLVLFTEEAKHMTNSVTITSSTQIVVFKLHFPTKYWKIADSRSGAGNQLRIYSHTTG